MPLAGTGHSVFTAAPFSSEHDDSEACDSHGARHCETHEATQGHVEVSAALESCSRTSLTCIFNSAASYDIIKTQRSIDKKLQKTEATALLQLVLKVFDLFDNVIILNEGKTLARNSSTSTRRGHGAPPAPSERASSQSPSIQAVLEDWLYGLQMLEYVSNDIDPMPEPQRSENASNDIGPILPRQQVGADGAPKTRVTMGNTTFREGRGLMVAVMALIDVSTYSNMDPMNLQVLLGGQLQV
ncbi:hypothetical protein PR003_g24842, partial [Phytophthora rubi]